MNPKFWSNMLVLIEIDVQALICVSSKLNSIWGGLIFNWRCWFSRENTSNNKLLCSLQSVVCSPWLRIKTYRPGVQERVWQAWLLRQIPSPGPPRIMGCSPGSPIGPKQHWASSTLALNCWPSWLRKSIAFKKKF